eukprot:6486304-Amphidinium_carterae.3
MTTDPTFTIELALLQSLVDGGCSTQVQTVILAALPDEKSDVSMEQAQTRIQEVIASPLCSWADASTQAAARVVLNILAGVSAGRAPSIDGGASQFLTQVSARIPFFCRASAPSASAADGKDDGSAEQTLCGAVAAEHLWKEVKNKKGVTLHDLEKVERFSWLLSPASAKALKAKGDQLAKEVKSAASGLEQSKSSASSSTSKTPTVGQLAKQKKRQNSNVVGDDVALKKSRQVFTDATAAADAMFA